MPKTAIVPIGSAPRIDPVGQLDKIIAYNSSIMENMLKNFNDSNGEVFDSRIIPLQKMILESIKVKADIDPAMKAKSLALEGQASLAIEMYKKQMKDQNVIRLVNIDEDVQDSK
jgi:hypothetical protein